MTAAATIDSTLRWLHRTGGLWWNGDPQELTARREAHRLIYQARPHWWTYVYAIQQGGDNGPIKIGVAKSPHERIKTLQQGSGEELHGIAAWWTFFHAESFMHEEHAAQRIRGEWFTPTAEMIADLWYRGGEFCDW